MMLACHGEQNGATAIYVAAQKGHAECIGALARHGADVNASTAVRALQSSIWNSIDEMLWQ